MAICPSSPFARLEIITSSSCNQTVQQIDIKKTPSLLSWSLIYLDDDFFNDVPDRKQNIQMK